MRSISNIARRTHRRNNSYDSNASSNNNSPKSRSNSSIRSPVWGRSAMTSASSPLTSTSPSPSAFASNSNSSSSSSSSSLSPRMWSRSKSKGIPIDNNTASSNNTRSLSPSRRPPHHRPQHSFDNANSIYNLATISENRRISSNTLNKITIKTPVSQLTKQLTESERSAQQAQQKQQQVRVREIKANNNNPYENENDDEDCELCGCGRGGGGGCLSILNPKTYRNFFDRNSIISIYSSGRRSRSRKKQWKKTHVLCVVGDLI